MASEVTVITEEGRDVDSAAIASQFNSIVVTTEKARLARGIVKVWNMLKEALTWHMKRADSTSWFLPPEAMQTKRADAEFWFALVEETLSDAVVYFTSTYHDRHADAVSPMGTEVHRNADSKTYFALEVKKRLADALFAFGTAQERNADAMVYFGTQVERSADSRTFFVHLSDVYNLQAFLQEFFPSLWYTTNWGTIPQPCPAGGSISCSYPPQNTYNKAVLLLGKSIQVSVWAKATEGYTKVADVNEQTAGWAVVFLPSDTQECLLQNLGGRQILAFFTWWS